jgi:hypothetical protein
VHHEEEYGVRRPKEAEACREEDTTGVAWSPNVARRPTHSQVVFSNKTLHVNCSDAIGGAWIEKYFPFQTEPNFCATS